MIQKTKHILFNLLGKIAMANLVVFLLVANTFAQSTLCSERTYTPSWDWRAQNYTFYLNSTSGALNFESPWYSRFSNNNNINAFRLQVEKDFEPADGWVLIQHDFGAPTRYVNHPYFILYNKYSGVLRIFVAIGAVVGQNDAAMVTLTYNNGSKRSAVLENHTDNTYRHALDQFDTDVPPVQVPNVYNFDLPYWLHADFVMNYDPCVCQEIQQLAFHVELVSNADLKFDLNGQFIEEIDSKGSRGGFGFQNLAKLGEGGFKAGTSFHKTTKSGLDVIPKIFPGAVNKFPFAENAAYNTIPGLGAAVGVAQFFVGSFGSDPLKQPMVYDVNLNATGTLTTTNPHPSKIFVVPGSDNLNLVPATLIQYNNPLGVFNLIETPTFIARQKNCSGEYIELCDYTFRLKERIKYTINPVIDVKPGTLDIMVALVPDGGESVIQPEFYEPISCFDGRSFSGIPESFNFDVGVKMLVSFETTDGNDVVYVSSYGANTVFSSTSLPLSNVSRKVNIANETRTSGVEAWNEIEITNSTLTSNGGSLISFRAGEKIILKQGTRIQRNVRLKNELPESCDFDLGFTDPSTFCRSSAYRSRTDSQARVAGSTNVDENSISDSEEFEGLVVYPNPSNGVFNLKTSNEVESMEVFDFSGKTIKLIELDQKLQQLDMRNAPRGVYLLKIRYVNGKNSTIKVMKE